MILDYVHYAPSIDPNPQIMTFDKFMICSQIRRSPAKEKEEEKT